MAGAMVKLFMITNDSECKRAERVLKEKGVQYSPIDVRRSGITSFLDRDIGANRVPALVTDSGTLVGLEEIRKFAEAVSTT